MKSSASSGVMALVLGLFGVLHATGAAADCVNQPSRVTLAARLDRRPVHESPRPVAIVEGELRALEHLLEVTPARSPDRPLLLRRVADAATELESAAGHDAAGLNPTVTTARGRAVRAYRDLTTDYPSDARADEALFYLGLELDAGGDAAGARRAYFQLIQSRPGSRLIPDAYLAFGEHFFEEGATDPAKWGLARQAYQKVLEYPAPGNRQYGYAAFKLGHTLWREGDAASAAQAFDRAIAWAAGSGAPDGAAVDAAARRDLAALKAACVDWRGDRPE